MIPTLKVESAQIENIICVSIKSDDDTGLTPGGGSSGTAHSEEWNIWGEDE